MDLHIQRLYIPLTEQYYNISPSTNQIDLTFGINDRFIRYKYRGKKQQQRGMLM